MAIGEWNLSELYKSNESFLSDLEHGKNLLREIEKFRGELSKNDPQIIYNFFKKDEELSILLDRLAVFAFCKKDDDGKNQENVKIYNIINDFYAKVGESMAFAKTELASLDTDVLNQLKNHSSFADYDRTLHDIIRFKKHTLSEKDEKNIAELSSFSNTNEIFSMLSNIEMEHGSYKDENGKRVKLCPGNYNSCLQSPDQKVRKNVMETYASEYKKMTQTFTSLFLSHIKYQNYLAKIYGFESVLDKKCYSEEVPTSVMKTCIRNVSIKVDLLHRYFKIKKKILGVSEFFTSDIPLEILNEEKVKISYEEAIDGISKAFEVLGKDYVEIFHKATHEGWIDAFPREGKTSGGYTISNFDHHPYILLNFDGTLEWASALAHEFGHAMHSYYSSKAQPYAKHDYTLFIAEIVSLTNEILYNRYLLSKASDKKTKMKLLSYFLQLFELNVFDSSMLAEFELFVHDSLWQGETLSSGELCSEYKHLAAKYFGNDVKFTKHFETGWMRKGHLYRDYYLYKYAMGLCCACFVATKILSDKSGDYISKYKQFLSLGSSLDPVSLLKVIDIDVSSDKIYEFAFKMFEEYLNMLEKLVDEN